MLLQSESHAVSKFVDEGNEVDVLLETFHAQFHPQDSYL